MTHPIGVGNSLSTRPVYNAKWMQLLYQYHAAAPPFVCVTLVRIDRSANVREFSLLVRNPSVGSAISMDSYFWNICRVMSSPEVLRSKKHMGFADYGRGGTSVCSCAIKQHYQAHLHGRPLISVTWRVCCLWCSRCATVQLIKLCSVITHLGKFVLLSKFL